CETLYVPYATAVPSWDRTPVVKDGHCKYHPRPHVSFSPIDPLTARHFAAGDCSGQRFAFRVVPPRHLIPIPSSKLRAVVNCKACQVSTEDDFKRKAS
ncbi:unnamed protein product, partial [Clavelina lepadiformis]